MKKVITIILLILISPISRADIRKCIAADGRVSYILHYANDPKAPANCEEIDGSTTELTRAEYEAHRQALNREDARQARLAYRERVKTTAKFLDDVEAARIKKK
jgi:hypothetical protein